MSAPVFLAEPGTLDAVTSGGPYLLDGSEGRHAGVVQLGQDVDRSLLDGVPGVRVLDGVVQVDENMMTGAPGVFAGGDAAPSTRSVTVAIGQGRAAAEHIDRWLGTGTEVGPVAGEQPIAGVDAAHLVEGMRASGHRSVSEIAGPDDLAAELAHVVKPGDFVVCLGAGDITKWAAGLASAIAGQRESAA